MGPDSELSGLYHNPVDSSSGRARTQVTWTRRASSVVEQSLNVLTSGKFSDGSSTRLFNFRVDSEKPSDEHTLYDLEENEVS